MICRKVFLFFFFLNKNVLSSLAPCAPKKLLVFLIVILKLDESDLTENCSTGSATLISTTPFYVLSSKTQTNKTIIKAPPHTHTMNVLSILRCKVCWEEQQKAREQWNNKNSILTKSFNLKTMKRLGVRKAIVCHLYRRREGNQYLFLGECQPQCVVLILSTG